jgi:hypothetical protein
LQRSGDAKAHSDTDRVVAREAYAKEHVAELLAELGVQDSGEDWQVCSAFVYESEILARHLTSVVPVFSVKDIVESDDRVEWIASVAAFVRHDP